MSGAWVRALALALLLPVAAAAGDPIIGITWDGDAGFRHDTAVEPGRFVEVCGPLAAGMAVRWQFDASAPLDFNVHYHVGREVHYPVKRTAVAQAAATLTAPSAQEYCWMWTNRGAQPARLAVSLQQRR